MKLQEFKEQIVKPYVNNALQAIRTAGGLLLGNSVLVYFDIIGKNGTNFWYIVVFGVILVLLCSWPFGVASNKEK